VPPHDVPALRRAVEDVLSDRDSAVRRAAAARQRVETELSFDTRTRRLEAIYEQLARERREDRAMRGVPRHA
jgi:glycosyltransferase involved in cell wall biosynthesis